jgi:hypothetical protein
MSVGDRNADGDFSDAPPVATPIDDRRGLGKEGHGHAIKYVGSVDLKTRKLTNID